MRYTKKIILIVLLTIIASCSVIFNVKAADASLKISCSSDTISPGESKSCEVIANNGTETIGAIEFTVGVSNGLSIDTSKGQNGIEGLNGFTPVVNNNVASLTNTTEVASGTSVARININASSDLSVGDKVTISLTSGMVQAAEVADETKELEVVGSANNTTTQAGGEATEEGTVTTTQDNPKTMDANVVVISGILLLGAVAVFVGKKKLNKIGK